MVGSDAIVLVMGIAAKIAKRLLVVADEVILRFRLNLGNLRLAEMHTYRLTDPDVFHERK